MGAQKRFSVRVLQGMHVGALAAFSEAERCVIGSDTACNIALLDEGVMPVHCVMYWQDGRLMCDAIQGAVRNGAERAAPGESLRVQTGVPLQCGSANMLIECLQGSHSSGHVSTDDETDLTGGADAAAPIWARLARALRNGAGEMDVSRKVRLAALGIFALGLSGVALALATWSSDGQADPRQLGEVQAWLRTVSPPGSELRAQYDQEARRFAIAGYLPTDYQAELLKRSLRESTYFPRADFISAEGMVNSFVRLVQMERLLCVAEYTGNGHVKCSNDIATEDNATRIRMLSKQVPGLRDIDLHVAPVIATAEPAPVAPVATPAVAPEPAAPLRWDGPRLAGKLSVWILKKDRFVLDWRGIRYRQGDLLDGMTVEKITVDEIQLSRNGNPYSIIVASQ